DAQKQALEYGSRVSGCTVHFVDEHLDHGPIIVQKAVPVLPHDDEHNLAARILEQEHIAYTEAINVVLSGEYEIVGRRVLLRTVRGASSKADLASLRRRLRVEYPNSNTAIPPKSSGGIRRKYSPCNRCVPSAPVITTIRTAAAALCDFVMK